MGRRSGPMRKHINVYPQHNLTPLSDFPMPVANVVRNATDGGKKAAEAEKTAETDKKALDEIDPTSAAAKSHFEKILAVHRHDLTLHCAHCRFVWQSTTLCIWCPKDPTHRQQEFAFASNFRYFNQLPPNYFQQMPLLKCPKTGRLIGKEDAKRARHGVGNEKRGLGLHEYEFLAQTERLGIARSISEVGQWRRKWKTHFPYPT